MDIFTNMWYEFYYPKSNVRQKLFLISHDVFLKYKEMPQDSNKQVKKAKAFLMEYTGGIDQWFTDKSPLFYAIYTGIIDCNGKHKCEAIELK